VFVLQHPAADVQHHRPVPLNQESEGVFIVLGGKAFQQLAVVGRAVLPGGDQPVKLVQNVAEGTSGHASGSGGVASTLIQAPWQRTNSLFFEYAGKRC